MNRKSAALLTVLARCNPQDRELNKESLIQQILHLDETRELAARTTLAPIFDEYFTEEKLRSYTDKQLYASLKAIPLIPAAAENIIYSLKNGAGPFLTADDRPDFMDADSLKRVIEKTKNASGKCYTNIKANDFMSIFAGSTIKTLGDAFSKLSVDCSDYAMEIDRLMAGRRYCISSDEVRAREMAFESKIAELEDSISRSKTRRKRYRFMKAEVGTLALLVPTIVAGATGAIAPGFVGGCTIAEILLAVVYWVMG